MDDNLTNVIEQAERGFRFNVDDSQENHCLEGYISKAVFDAGYRLDPYPNGKSKPELIARIEAVEAERDKTRNLLREEHTKLQVRGMLIRTEDALTRHKKFSPDCPVCTFLAETSSVKP